MNSINGPTTSTPSLPPDEIDAAILWWARGGFAVALAKHLRRSVVHALALLLCVLSPASALAADAHEHLWSDPVCEAQTCVGRCCSKKCVKGCTYPGCKMIRVWSETSCSNSGGASGEYSTGPMSIDIEPMSTPWGPRPGGAGPAPAGNCADGQDHDWDEERCGTWSYPYPHKPDCEVQYCDRQCLRCRTNGKGRLNKRGQCRAPARDHDHDVAQVSIWGPRPGSSGSDACPPHDYGAEQCGGWSAISPTCKIRHCTSQCRKCLSNGRDRYESRPAGCFDD